MTSRHLLDLAIRNATVATSSGVATMDIGVADGKIVQLGRVQEAAEECDALGLIVTPGGVDTHTHLDQVMPGMGHGAESLATGGRSALAGGTTTAITFVTQLPEYTLSETLNETLRRGDSALIDFGLHQIVTDPTPEILAEIPSVIDRGVRSLKAFLTYDDARLNDDGFLNVLEAARRGGAMVAVHCENFHAIGWLTEKLLADGRKAPKYHAWSRPVIVEREATYRAICLAELVDTPIQIFHVSCAEVAEEIARAQARGVKVWGETCPQYLTLTDADLDRPGFEGAGYVCSPALRSKADHEGLWEMIRRGVIDVITSDHAPSNLTGPNGKDAAGRDAPFSDIPNGVPGIGARMPLVFSEGVSTGRISLDHFVRLTATNPAKLYGLAPRKGDIVVGADADLVLWDPQREVKLTNDIMQHAIDYTPYEGKTVTGWPVATYLRGQIVMRDGEVFASEGTGQYLSRDPYPLATPRGEVPNDFFAANIDTL